MEHFFQMIEKINNQVNSIVWGIPMLLLLVGTGIFLTIRTGFFQLTKSKYTNQQTFFAIFKKPSVTKSKDKKAISQFQALSTALAATIGTGNIAGVATAISIGGPGAVFWMWFSAFFGMMTNYSENVLGIYFRKKNVHSEWSGGAMYYLENGLGNKKGMKHVGKGLAIIFCIFCILASFGIGNMTQINSIASSMETAFLPTFGFRIPGIVTGVVLAIIAALVIIGGIKRIAKVTEKLVPFMAVAYIIAALIIFFSNFKQIPYVFGSIFQSAFSFAAIGGGIGGAVVKQAITMGFKRGVFSNEAGLGSSVMVHSASDVVEPVVQGMWGIFEVFFDTIIVCTLTAFVLLSSTTGKSTTLTEALNQISTDTQYIEIANADAYEGSIPLIDENDNEVYELYSSTDQESAKGETYTVHTIYGQELEAIFKNTESKEADDYVFTNLMTVKGVEAVDSNNNVIKDENGNPVISSIEIERVNGVPLVTFAFSQKFGDVAGILLAFAILLFAFSTVLGWSFYGTKAVEYLFGTKATIVYKVIFIGMILVGATMSLELAWNIADTLNGLMAIPNLIGVLGLSGLVIKITKNYVERKACKNPEKLKPMISAYEEIQKEQEKKLEAE